MSEWVIEDGEQIEFAEEVSEVELTLVSGDVAVRAGGTTAELEVRAVVGPPVEVSLVAGALKISQGDGHGGREPGSRERSASISLSVPGSHRCRVKTVSAAVTVAGVDGELTVGTVSGDITLDQVEALAAISTVSGSVAARGISQDFRGHTVSGELSLEAFAGASTWLKTVSGTVVADLSEAAPAGSVEVNTTSGEILLRLAARASQEVRVESVSGDLKSAFIELTSDRSPGRRRLSGSLGDGEGRVEVRTVSGSVSLLAGAKS